MQVHLQPPDDASDLRGFLLLTGLGKPATWLAIAAFAAAAGVAGAAIFSPAIGAVAVAAALLASLLVVFAIAGSHAEDSFFETYAGQRGLEPGGRGPRPGRHSGTPSAARNSR